MEILKICSVLSVLGMVWTCGKTLVESHNSVSVGLLGKRNEVGCSFSNSRSDGGSNQVSNRITR